MIRCSSSLHRNWKGLRYYKNKRLKSEEMKYRYNFLKRRKKKKNRKLKNGYYSDESTIKSGVPQSSVLEPLSVADETRTSI